jgi:two-component system, NtrC family, response regulator AtoC
MADGGSTTIDLVARGQLVVPEFQLAVVGPEDLTTIPLPPGREYLIGRGATVHVRLNDEGVSREHAKLVVADRSVQIEDLGGVNGTVVAGTKLLSRTPTLLRCGNPVLIGSTTLMLQQLVSVPQRRRIWSHVYFLGRLEEECFKAQMLASPFAVMRLRLPHDLADAQIGTLLSPALSPFDLIARYGARDWEILLHGQDRGAAEATSARIVTELGRRQSDAARFGIAVYGVEGREPATLLGAASTAVHGGAADAAAPSTTLVAVGPRIRNLLQAVAKAAAARSDSVSILVLGENGVGKTLLARWIHDNSPRGEGAFHRIDLGELARPLIESELFGHKKGAFTGATEDKPGLLEQANGGTLFLDEVGELPADLQIKLLSALQERRVRRIGEMEPRRIDVRVIAATSRDLRAEMEGGRFRRELYHRLAVFLVVVPPLRERVSEIEPLARTFLARFAAEEGLKTVPELSGEALAALERHRWPGNIREIQNAIQRAVVSCSGSLVEPDDLGLTGELHDVSDEAVDDSEPDLADLSEEQIRERKQLIAMIKKHDSVMERAIKASGIGKTAFYRRLHALRIPLKSSAR